MSAAVAPPALAHHSYAMFDRAKRVTLVGEAQDVVLENPHSWMRVLIPNERGEPVAWSFEMGPPRRLRQQGWHEGLIHAGDKVTVTFHPMKDGSALGQLITVVLPDGKTLVGGPTEGGSNEDD